MDQETFNLGIRKLLETVGVSSQREIKLQSWHGSRHFPDRVERG